MMTGSCNISAKRRPREGTTDFSCKIGFQQSHVIADAFSSAPTRMEPRTNTVPAATFFLVDIDFTAKAAVPKLAKTAPFDVPSDASAAPASVEPPVIAAAPAPVAPAPKIDGAVPAAVPAAVVPDAKVAAVVPAAPAAADPAENVVTGTKPEADTTPTERASVINEATTMSFIG
eukprot:TRINITY_DN5838_c0_g1_i1.p2 TRINITY_DN5838_c0_g1~~TRINITY_DN5838_c0_g1_i1.p2  ORF type:complete len:174 (+),score=22.06 TRINITY_DN5838_c0_g1_i1:320-841(+)